jgi:hypothetical protein
MTNLQFFCLKLNFVCGSVSVWEQSYPLVMLGQTLVLMQMTFLNNVRKVGRLVLSRTSLFFLLLKSHDGRRSLTELISFSLSAILDPFQMRRN